MKIPLLNIVCRIAVVGLLLSSFMPFARAEWREIERFEDGMRIYADRAGVQREGDVAHLSHLVRWGEPQEEPGQPAYLSTLVRMRYDCAGKREKYLSSLSFSGAMGDGIKVAADGHEAERWDPVSSGSMEEKLWKIACGMP